jgi:hypothetical protein
MGNPNYPSNGQSERVDAYLDASGTAYLKGAIGLYTPVWTGEALAAAWVGTHVDGQTLLTTAAVGTDAFVAIAGVDGTTVRKILVDTAGRILATPAQSARKGYTVSTGALAPTAAKELFVIESYAAAVVRLLRIVIWNVGSQTTPGVRLLQLLRTTTAGSSGAVTPAPLDAADGAYSGLCRVTPTAGTESTVIDQIPIYVPSAAAAMAPIVIDFDGLRALKAPAIPAGTANGIALKDPGATGAAGIYVTAYFTDGA